MKKYLLLVLASITLTSCSVNKRLNSSNMDKLELGMTKDQVTGIMGKNFRIAEKRMEDKNQIEIISYRYTFSPDEIYLFEFIDGKLEKWHRELLPKHEIINN